MHKKEFWILTIKCGNKLKHENYEVSIYYHYNNKTYYKEKVTMHYIYSNYYSVTHNNACMHARINYMQTSGDNRKARASLQENLSGQDFGHTRKYRARIGDLNEWVTMELRSVFPSKT
jgi:hypothetical protein